MDGIKEQDLKFYEIEVKFRIDESRLNDWKVICRAHAEENPDEFIEYIPVDSDDDYYVPSITPKDLDYQFIRHRYSTTNSRAELTTKKKLSRTNNIIRKEWNIRVDNNSHEAINSWLTEGVEYKYAFTITKFVQIYKFKQVTLPFYTVIDHKGNRDTFMEIEVNEEKLASGEINEAGAWELISKYEKLLAPLGITARNRLRLSLFEMYFKQGENR